MSHLNSGIAVIGIDIGKNSFQLVGQDRRGAILLRQKRSRSAGPFRHPVQRDPRAVLGAVKGGLAARKRGARPARRPPLTAPARGASARAGRDEGTAARHEQRNSVK